MLKVAAITGGRDVPSARFRVRQYVPVMKEHGVSLCEYASHTSSYPPSQRVLRPVWGVLRLMDMARVALDSHRFDVTLLQREMVSTYATLERWTGRPRVLDVDDAIHLFRGGAAAKALATGSDRVICGNIHLAEIYSQWNQDVVVLPTAVDTDRFRPRTSPNGSEKLVLGWIGTSANLKYLHNIEPALALVMKRNPGVILSVVCDKPPQFERMDSTKVKFTPWSAGAEVDLIQTFDVGLMPLEDSPWARSKCSFKMLQYMACGLPVVVSPVGMNGDVLELGDIGRGAKSQDDWVDCLCELVQIESMRARMGANGRKVTELEFSLVSLAPRFAKYLRASRS